ncbi:beta-lactamase family protein [bacterium]|nr:beta-lactamase family protein [bacterium]
MRNYNLNLVNLMLNLLCSISLASLMVSCNTSSPASEFDKKLLDEYLDTHYNNGQFSGVVQVYKSDSLMYSYSKGYADLESKIPLNSSFSFRIGSLTKPFTAALICKLHLSDKLNINDSLYQYFPVFTDYASVTIMQLLNHTSGIPDYHYLKDWEQKSKTKLKPEELVSFCHEQLQPDFDPGTQFRYSNTAYILLGLIAEQVCDTTFEAALREFVLAPLNLENTGVDHPNDERSFARGFETGALKRKKAPYINLLQPFTSGNMYSTSEDIQRFTQAIFNQSFLGAHFSEEILSSEAPGYCLGWGIRKDSLGIYYGHLGAMNGFQAALAHFPIGNFNIIVLSNEQNCPKSSIINDLRKNILLGESISTETLNYLNLDREALLQYTGDFMIKPGDTLHVWVQDNQILMRETAQDTLEVYPIENNKCAVEQVEFLFEYSKDFNEIQFLNSSGLVAKRIEAIE